MVYPFTQRIIFPFIRNFITETMGYENLPTYNSFIIAANHISVADPLFIIATLFPKYRKKIYFIARRNKNWRGFEKIIVQRWAGCITLNRNKPGKGLLTAADKLNDRGIVGIFPEGLRTPVGNGLNKAKTGAVRLALGTQKPIIPIGIKTNGEPHRLRQGKNYDYWKKQLDNYLLKNKWVYTLPNKVVDPDKKTAKELSDQGWQLLNHNLKSYYRDAFNHYLLKGTRVKMAIGKPIVFSNHYNKPITKELTNNLTTKLMLNISQLSGRLYNY